MLAATPRIASAQQSPAVQTALEPLVWPVVAKVPPGVYTFAGHQDTVPDIVGRFGTPASLVIFSEGNHLMVLHGDDILGAFSAWAKSQVPYANLNLDNVILVTLPQPIIVHMINFGAIMLGNLMLDVTRAFGYYPISSWVGAHPCNNCSSGASLSQKRLAFRRVVAVR
jgi:hypothetical protein